VTQRRPCTIHRPLLEPDGYLIGAGGTGPASGWYGSSAAWQVNLLAAARRRYGDGVQLELGMGELTCRHVGLEVRGRRMLIPVAIRFYAQPRYHCFGLPPQDYPLVFADPDAASPHRFLNDALCLYYPKDPPDLRWTSDRGLASLLDLIEAHLFFEEYWRRTGGLHRGLWLGDEAPHGIPGRAA